VSAAIVGVLIRCAFHGKTVLSCGHYRDRTLRVNRIHYSALVAIDNFYCAQMAVADGVASADQKPVRR
jgi:hypothetical protein